MFLEPPQVHSTDILSAIRAPLFSMRICGLIKYRPRLASPTLTLTLTHIAVYPVRSYVYSLSMDARNLPHLPMSVSDFCRRAQELRDEDDAKFVKFVLTGKDGQGQAVVDPILDSVKPTEEMQLTRDYDSLLGMCPDIKVHGSLTVYPLAKNDDTLTRNTHFTYPFQYRAVCNIFLF